MIPRRSFLGLRPLALGVLAGLGGLALPAAEARADSCADFVTIIIPAVAVDPGSEDLTASSLAPTDIEPVALLDHACTTAPSEVDFTLRRVTDDVAIAAERQERGGADWTEYSLALEAPLEPATQHELCFDADVLFERQCVLFTTTEGVAAPPSAPSLTVHGVETISGDSADFAEVDAEASWSAFPGAVWIEARGSSMGPQVLADDASTEESARGIAFVGVGDEDQLCVVAVAVGASGERVESEPSCSEVGGCSVGGAPGRAGSQGLALGLAVLGAGALVRRRRGR